MQPVDAHISTLSPSRIVATRPVPFLWRHVHVSEELRLSLRYTCCVWQHVQYRPPAWTVSLPPSRTKSCHRWCRHATVSDVSWMASRFTKRGRESRVESAVLAESRRDTQESRGARPPAMSNAMWRGPCGMRMQATAPSTPSRRRTPDTVAGVAVRGGRSLGSFGHSNVLHASFPGTMESEQCDDGGCLVNVT